MKVLSVWLAPDRAVYFEVAYGPKRYRSTWWTAGEEHDELAEGDWRHHLPDDAVRIG